MSVDTTGRPAKRFPRRQGTPVLLFFLLLAGTAGMGPAAVAASPGARGVDLRIGGGGWSLSPFRTLVERRGEELIRREFAGLLGSILPDSLLFPVRSEVGLSSSGTFLSAAVGIPLGNDRWSLEFRGDLFRFRLPFVTSARETFGLFGFPIADLEVRGTGAVTLKGLAASFLGRYVAVRAGRFDLALQAGATALPFEGRIETTQIASVRTPLGDLSLPGRFERSIRDLRALGFDAPRVILSPLAGVEALYRVAPKIGVYLEAVLSQGVFVSAGLRVGL